MDHRPDPTDPLLRADEREESAVPDPWEQDPLSRPAVPPHDARDPISQTHRRDTLEEARRVARVRGRRAGVGSIVIPLTILEALPLSWIILDHPAVGIALRLGLAVCVLLWWQWYQAISHRNAWEGEVLSTSDDPGD